MKMHSLTKQNFWDALAKDYPQATQHFCQWIDQYKPSVDWLNLFNDGIVIRDSSTEFHKTEAPKFHEIPIELQYGVLSAYFVQEHKTCLLVDKIGNFYRGNALIGCYNNYTSEWPSWNYCVADLVQKAFELMQAAIDEHGSKSVGAETRYVTLNGLGKYDGTYERTAGSAGIYVDNSSSELIGFKLWPFELQLGILLKWASENVPEAKDLGFVDMRKETNAGLAETFAEVEETL